MDYHWKKENMQKELKFKMSPNDCFLLVQEKRKHRTGQEFHIHTYGIRLDSVAAFYVSRTEYPSLEIGSEEWTKQQEEGYSVAVYFHATAPDGRMLFDNISVTIANELVRYLSGTNLSVEGV